MDKHERCCSPAVPALHHHCQQASGSTGLPTGVDPATGAQTQPHSKHAQAERTQIELQVFLVCRHAPQRLQCGPQRAHPCGRHQAGDKRHAGSSSSVRLPSSEPTPATNVTQAAAARQWEASQQGSHPCGRCRRKESKISKKADLRQPKKVIKQKPTLVGVHGLAQRALQLHKHEVEASDGLAVQRLVGEQRCHLRGRHRRRRSQCGFKQARA